MPSKFLNVILYEPETTVNVAVSELDVYFLASPLKIPSTVCSPMREASVGRQKTATPFSPQSVSQSKPSILNVTEPLPLSPLTT